MLKVGDMRGLVDKFSFVEVRNVVWECEGSKSPGFDGFNFKFINNWDIFKVDVGRMLEEFHFRGVIPRGCNSSFIALIPKVGDPIGLNECRPIFLVGFLYEIISKVLTNRLKLVMGSIL